MKEREYKVIGVVLDLPEMSFSHVDDARSKAWQEMERSYWDLPENPYVSVEWVKNGRFGGQTLLAETHDGKKHTLARVWPVYPLVEDMAIETMAPPQSPPDWDEIAKWAGVTL